MLEFLHHECDSKLSFFSQYINKEPPPWVNHTLYKPDATRGSEHSYFFSRFFEANCRSMYGVYQALEAAQLGSLDLFVGHAGFGTLGLLHVAYQRVPTIGYFEWFYDPFKPETYSRPHEDNPLPNVMRMPLRNASQLLELEYCTKGYSPTRFQRCTYPETYQHKLSTRFDGIDTELYQPGIPSAESQLKRTWPTGAKLITFVSRGLEAFRGFDIFMEVAHKLSLKREDVHFAIAGKPQTNYGNEKNLKDDVMERWPYDLNRFHFFEWLSEPALADLFRISDCHFYWTIPFTLSWSFFQAMASGCLVLASDSEPVRDALVHEQNGLMAQPYDIDEMVDKLCEALDDPGQFQPLRDAARETIVNDYSFQVCLPRLAEFYLSETV